MPTNYLTHISGQSVTEHYECDEMGACACGRPVRKIMGSNFTNRTDGVRYAKPDDTQGWCMFRCDACGDVIADSYTLSSPAAIHC